MALAEATLKDLIRRTDDQIEQGAALTGRSTVPREVFEPWCAASLDLIRSTVFEAHGHLLTSIVARGPSAHAVSEALGVLRTFRLRLEDALDDTRGTTSPPPSPPSPDTAVSTKVFVVHGHDEPLRLMVENFLHRHGLEPIVLQNEPTEVRTVIEKFEQQADATGFVVVLLAPDDYGYPVSEQRKPCEDRNGRFRARQNVILELGYFAGKLGRSRVCAIFKEEVDLPSDIHGMVYMPAHPSFELPLLKELARAGFNVSLGNS